jgi:hypothetical protein
MQIYDIIEEGEEDRQILMLKNILLNTKIWGLFPINKKNQIHHDELEAFDLRTDFINNTAKRMNKLFIGKTPDQISSILEQLPSAWEYILYMKNDFDQTSINKRETMLSNAILSLANLVSTNRFTLEDHNYIISFIEKYRGIYGLTCLNFLFNLEAQCMKYNTYFYESEQVCPFITLLSTNIVENIKDGIQFEYFKEVIKFIIAMKYKLCRKEDFDIDKVILQMILRMERREKEKNSDSARISSVMVPINNLINCYQDSQTDIIMHLFPLLCHLMIVAKKEDLNIFMDFVYNHKER